MGKLIITDTTGLLHQILLIVSDIRIKDTMVTQTGTVVAGNIVGVLEVCGEVLVDISNSLTLTGSQWQIILKSE